MIPLSHSNSGSAGKTHLKQDGNPVANCGTANWRLKMVRLELRSIKAVVRPDDWRGVQPRERVIKQALFDILKDKDEVERIFRIIKAQKEY